MAISDSDLLFGPIGHGGAFTDGTQLKTTNLTKFILILAIPRLQRAALKAGPRLAANSLPVDNTQAAAPRRST